MSRRWKLADAPDPSGTRTYQGLSRHARLRAFFQKPGAFMGSNPGIATNSSVKACAASFR
jgi:hypothetical protein